MLFRALFKGLAAVPPTRFWTRDLPTPPPPHQIYTKVVQLGLAGLEVVRGPLASAIPGGTLYDDLAADSWLTIGGENATTATALQSVGIDFTSFEKFHEINIIVRT